MCYCHLARPSSLPSPTDLHLFKEGIRPLWEVTSRIMKFVCIKKFSLLGHKLQQNSLSGLSKLQWREVDNKVQEGCLRALLGGPGKAIDG